MWRLIYALILIPSLTWARPTQIDDQQIAAMMEREQRTIAAALAQLPKATQFELLAIKTSRFNTIQRFDSPDGPVNLFRCLGWCFREHRVQGSVEIRDPSDVEIVRSELQRWLEAPEPTSVMMCFVPHHGVRMQVGEEIYEFEICYECEIMRITRQQPGGFGATYLKADRALLDGLLRRHGIDPTGLDLDTDSESESESD